MFRKNKDNKKKRKLEPGDEEWLPTQSNPRKKPKTSHGSFYPARADKSRYIGETSNPLKTSYKLSKDLSYLSPDARAKVENKPPHTYRPIGEVLAISPSGNPTVVQTPNKTKLFRQDKFGSILFFSNVPAYEQSTLSKDHLNPEFPQSKLADAIKAPTGATKKTTIHITPQLLKQSFEAKRARGDKRHISQAKAMTKENKPYNHSQAKNYIESTFDLNEQLKKQNYEWTHLIAHSVLDTLAQTAANIVCANKNTNTAMILVEANYPKICKHYPDGFKLEVTSDQVEDTHVAEKITMQIKTKDFNLKFTFDGLNTKAPHQDYLTYINIMFDALMDENRDKDKPAASKPTL